MLKFIQAQIDLYSYDGKPEHYQRHASLSQLPQDLFKLFCQAKDQYKY
jgi:hypothetical protein